MAALCRVAFFGIESTADAARRLRAVLADELSIDPEAVELVTDEEGKPRLAATVPRDLRFNLSHSGEVAGLALCDGVEVGLDLERVTERRSFGYVQDWSRREAYLKGTGAGLRGSPRKLDFARAGGGWWKVVEKGEPVDAWRVIDLSAPPGYAAALAAESEVDVSVSLDPALGESGQGG